MQSAKTEVAATKASGLTWKHRVGYAAGDAGGVLTLILVGYMTRYITNVLEVSYGILSVLLLIWNFWDMFNDPIVGTLMDKSFAKSKGDKDKFRPWILASIPVITIGLVAFFTVPSFLGGISLVISLFILKIIYEWGYTMMNIAMGSLLGAMALNDTERATLSSARGLGSSFGALGGGIIIPQVLASLGENPRGYMIASLITAALAGVIIFLHFSWTQERNASARVVVNDTPENKVKFTDIINVFRKNRAFLALSLHSVIIVFGTFLYSTFNPYMYADVFGDISMMTYTSIISQVLAISLLSIAPALTKLMGGTVKVIKNCLALGIILNVALFVVMLSVDVVPLLFLVISSIGYGLINMSVQLQWGLVSEAIDYNEYLTGKRTEGAIYGTFSLTRRVGQTISQSIGVLMIGWIGYNPELTNQGLTQSDGTTLGIVAMTLIAPAAAAVMSWAIFTFVWNINDDLRADISAWRIEQAAGKE